MERIKELVNGGVNHLPEMKRHLRNFVMNELFKDELKPLSTDARFFPNGKTILNHMYLSKRSMRYVSFVGFVAFDKAFFYLIQFLYFMHIFSMKYHTPVVLFKNKHFSIKTGFLITMQIACLRR